MPAGHLDARIHLSVEDSELLIGGQGVCGCGAACDSGALVVERSLAKIDEAIADSRRALQGQPGSLLAQESLFDAYRRKVALLQDLIALAGDAQRKGVDDALETRGRS